jgi:energy-coupling factor transporter ATP-binding protein EcfA2
MSRESELLNFSRSRQGWQQDLIRRICTQPELSSEDMQQAIMNLGAWAGLCKPSEMVPLAEGHLTRRTSDQHTATTVGAISNVENVNQLAPNQHLPFALSGITLVYGQNGSGKTGYARILKQLCRARRDKDEPLLGNVYKAVTKPARASVTYFVGDRRCDYAWEDGKPVPDELARISVFDAETAPLYADRQNEIEFLPLGLDVLPRLGKACEEMKARLQSKISDLASVISVPLPKQVAGTRAEEISQRLSLLTPEEKVPTDQEIQETAAWSEEDGKRLEEIEIQLKKLSEPARAAAQCRRFKTSLEGFAARLAAVGETLRAEAVGGYQTQLLATQTARAAAVAAAKGRFDRDPLGGAIESEAWRKLYEYAEKFNAIAYPGDEFPATGKDRVCLLCQQPLTEQAADRMNRFKAFIQDTSQREARQHDLKLEGMLRTVTSLIIPTIPDLNLHFLDLSATEPSFEPIRIGLTNFLDEAFECRKNCATALKGESSFKDLRGLGLGALNDAVVLATGFEDKAKEFDKAVVDTTATKALQTEHTQSLGRRQLSSSVATFLSRRSEIERYQKLCRCKNQCDTDLISRKNSEFRRKYQAADFVRKINAEIKFLGLEYLPIKVDSRTEKGTSYIGVALSQMLNVKSSNILSEGEFRALALACYFAEIGTIPNHDGIVVDDPVSSLDHRHVRQVAIRLLNEAKVRPQVIVFTHDLSFYYELWVAASEAQIPVQRNWVQQDKVHGFGVVATDESPWEVKRVKERIGVLAAMLQRMPEDVSSQEDHAKQVHEFYSRLRETWERLVEECLLNGVVGRFQPGVMTLSLRGVSVTDDDHRMVYFAMKKASEYSGHDRPVAREGTLPNKDEIARDLAILKEYAKELTDRGQKLSGKRRELEEPPKARVLPTPPERGETPN